MIKNEKIKVAIIGTGGMARQHAEAYSRNRHCRLVAAVDVDIDKAGAFAKQHGIPEIYSSAAELLKKSKIDAVSVVVPDRFHAPVSIECLKAGKHVLCEKPLATDVDEARRMARIAKASGKVNMVNFSYRSLPAIPAMKHAIESGKLGELKHVEGSYLQSWLTATVDGGWKACPPLLWRLSSGHGSKGVLGDVGVHLIDLLMFLAGPIRSVQCQLKTFQKAPKNRIGEFMLDANDSALAVANFKNGAMGVFHTTRWSAGSGNRILLRLSGSEGTVEFDTSISRTSYRICSGHERHFETWKTVECKPVPTNFEKFIRAIRTGSKESPTFAEGVAVQAILDSCFEPLPAASKFPASVKKSIVRKIRR